MEYNIGHYSFGEGTSFNPPDVGLTPQNYSTMLTNMRTLFRKYRPDVLCMNEYWQYLDRAMTHLSDPTLFDELFQYKWQSTQWNSFKSNVDIISSRKKVMAGDFKETLINVLTNGETSVMVITCHLPLPLADKISAMTELIEYAKEYTNVIIAGDFNTNTTSEENSIYGIAEAKGFQRVNGGIFTKQNTWNYTNPSVCIDNILVKGNIEVEDFQVLTTDAQSLCSDHIPIYADLIIK